jgi:enoyl-CoA hydratase/carnithine racemase
VPEIRFDDADGVRTIVIDRAEAKNAFTRDMWIETRRLLLEADARDNIKVIVLTGVGDVFTAGADLKEMQSAVASSADAGRPFHEALDALEHFSKPAIAAVNGTGVGIGFTMLPYFDIVVMADAARLKAPFATMGLAPEAGSSASLPARMGWQAASHAFFTGAWIDAASALESGLAWKVVPAAELAATVAAVAAEIAKNPLVSLVETKALMRAARGDAVREARQRESEVFRRLLAQRNASSS